MLEIIEGSRRWLILMVLIRDMLLIRWHRLILMGIKICNTTTLLMEQQILIGLIADTIPIKWHRITEMKVCIIQMLLLGPTEEQLMEVKTLLLLVRNMLRDHISTE
jgi:hypothetical protein